MLEDKTFLFWKPTSAVQTYVVCVQTLSGRMEFCLSTVEKFSIVCVGWQCGWTVCCWWVRFCSSQCHSTVWQWCRCIYWTQFWWCWHPNESQEVEDDCTDGDAITDKPVPYDSTVVSVWDAAYGETVVDDTTPVSSERTCQLQSRVAYDKSWPHDEVTVGESEGVSE